MPGYYVKRPIRRPLPKIERFYSKEKAILFELLRDGIVYLNSKHFRSHGYDSHVRKLIQRGDVVFKRTMLTQSPFDNRANKDYTPICVSYLKVTAQGRARAERLFKNIK